MVHQSTSSLKLATDERVYWNDYYLGFLFVSSFVCHLAASRPALSQGEVCLTRLMLITALNSIFDWKVIGSIATRLGP